MTVGIDVFPMFSKVDKDCAEVNVERYKLLQTGGTATPKTRSPIVFNLEGSTTSLWLDVDGRHFRESSSTAYCRSLSRHSGAVLLRRFAPPPWRFTPEVRPSPENDIGLPWRFPSLARDISGDSPPGPNNVLSGVAASTIFFSISRNYWWQRLHLNN